MKFLQLFKHYLLLPLYGCNYSDSLSRRLITTAFLLSSTTHPNRHQAYLTTLCFTDRVYHSDSLNNFLTSITILNTSLYTCPVVFLWVTGGLLPVHTLSTTIAASTTSTQLLGFITSAPSPATALHNRHPLLQLGGKTRDRARPSQSVGQCFI